MGIVFDCILNVSGKESVDLLFYKDCYLENFEKYCAHETNHNWSWAIDGSPRESAEQNDQGILESQCDGLYLCGGSKDSTFGTHPLTFVSPPFDKTADIVCHDLGPSADVLPSKFAGMSGGGVWQVSFQGNDGIPEKVDEIFFSGVFVAETPQSLYSRGPSALYEVFIEYLDTLQ